MATPSLPLLPSLAAPLTLPVDDVTVAAALAGLVGLTTVVRVPWLASPAGPAPAGLDVFLL